MNERIKELWEEAAKTTQGDSWEEQTKFMEKFAELIIKECAGLFPITFTDEQYQRRIDKTILKHFDLLR